MLLPWRSFLLGIGSAIATYENNDDILTTTLVAYLYIGYLIISTTSRNVTSPYPLCEGTLIALGLILTTAVISKNRPAFEWWVRTCAPGVRNARFLWMAMKRKGRVAPSRPFVLCFVLPLVRARGYMTAI